ncbi:MAG: AI-2E family transporter [Patescibacteria group bacterium]|jgi:predicted PurR-regulated permease PerM
MKPQKVEITYKSIVFFVLFILSLVLLWQIRSLLALLFMCFLFMEILNPLVQKFENHKIPRPLAIILIYILILLISSFAVASIAPVFIEQTSALINSLPRFLNDFELFGLNAVDISSQFRIIENLPSSIAKAIISIFNNLLSIFVVSVITFYLLIERTRLDKHSYVLLGEKGKDIILEVIEKTEVRLGHWFNAQIFLMFIIGLMSYLGFLLLGLPYAVPLAILAGFLELIPNIGPTVSTIAASAIGLTVSPLTALLAVVWGIIVQQSENNIIVPRIMKSSVGLNPLVTIIVLATGAKLAGVLGAVIAIPTYLIFESIVKTLVQEKNKTKSFKETVKPNSV